MVTISQAPKVTNGVFTVRKEGTDQRLIIDCRRSNAHFCLPPKVNLPNPSHLTQLHLPQHCSLYVGKSDISNYYHQLRLPPWLVPFFGIPSFTLQEMLSLNLDPSLFSPSMDNNNNNNNNTLFTPCCTTLPMGWSHSVFVAQSIHEHILYDEGTIQAGDSVLNDSSGSFLNDRVLHLCCVDDLVVMQLQRIGVNKHRKQPSGYTTNISYQ